MRTFRPAAAIFAALLIPAVAPGIAGAKTRDRDHDHMPDRWEVRHKLNAHRNDARGDRDHDGLRNLAEFRAGTDPVRRDSDRDGMSDGAEHAGTVLTFADGVLTVALADGSAVTGKVDARTRIVCPATATAASDDEDHSGPGDDEDHSGPGDGDREDEAGDDRDDDAAPTAAPTPSPTVDDHGDDDEGDDDHGDDADDDADDDRAACGTEALVAGTPVKEAELKLSSAGKVFKKVRLGAAPAPTAASAG